MPLCSSFCRPPALLQSPFETCSAPCWMLLYYRNAADASAACSVSVLLHLLHRPAILELLLTYASMPAAMHKVPTWARGASYALTVTLIIAWHRHPPSIADCDCTQHNGKFENRFPSPCISPRFLHSTPDCCSSRVWICTHDLHVVISSRFFFFLAISFPLSSYVLTCSRQPNTTFRAAQHIRARLPCW